MYACISYRSLLIDSKSKPETRKAKTKHHDNQVNPERPAQTPLIDRNGLLLGQAIADKSFHAVIICTKASQLYFLGVFDFFGVAVTPFDGHVRVRIGIY